MLSKRVVRANRDMSKVSKVAKINSCRVCNSKNLVSVLSLGNQFPNDFIADDIKLNSDDRVPLDLLICDEKNCGLLQLKHTYSRSDLYENYWFRSSVNETMKKALEDITDDIEKRIALKENDIVLDIGCNDGTLLKSYQKNKIQLVGFEPSNLYKEAVSEETNIINDFFSFEAFEKIYSKERCTVITSIAMFYDLEDPNKFVGDVARCMDEQGVWIIQMAYLEPMIQLNGFDNIVHEHLEYYSLFSLTNLLSRHALEVFDVQMNDVYGGSFRVYIKHKKNKKIITQPSVEELESKEKLFGFTSVQTYIDFADRVESIKNTIIKFIENEKSKDKLIYGYGASTKGNTTLQFFGIDENTISKIADRDVFKFGKKTVGTNLEIISEEQAREERPDYFFILPWHLVDYFIEREKQYLSEGGKFIVPMPNPRVISKDSIIDIEN